MPAPEDWMPKGKAGSARSAALMAAWPPGERGRPPGPKWLKRHAERIENQRRRKRELGDQSCGQQPWMGDSGGFYSSDWDEDDTSGGDYEMYGSGFSKVRRISKLLPRIADMP